MSEENALIFPCQFPIKAMGRVDIELDLLVLEIIQKHASIVSPSAVRTRASKKGTYVSVTVTIEATSKQQLDAIYQELTAHPAVLAAL
ncbi:YbeD family protein [Methylocucumis oryzae]|uniref:UPF0250 protein VZ94_18200 n=1 Tax=Methylocucumis oryzae TaxID=1632867 RepID=A0A0F3IF37_9GAMM|nr:DUF493 domain-containing protein [Methylocucumis oryzae]KJV05435.1 lipoate regulatory protein YbeD [Methylocucumis oryzae]